MRQDYKKENGEILAYISVGISCETRVRRNYLCSCAIALMHLTRGRMETDKLFPAAGTFLKAASKYVSPPQPTVSFFRGNNYDVKEELEPVAKIMWIPCMET